MKPLRIIIFFALLFYTQFIQSQSIFDASVFVGLNISQVEGDEVAGFNKIGIRAGINGIILLSEKVEAKIGIVYDQRGSRNGVVTQNLIAPFKLNLDYVGVPLTVVYKDFLNEEDLYYHVHVKGGFMLGRLIGRKQADFPLLTPQCIDSLGENDLSFLVGATFFFTEHIGGGFQFQRSITKVKGNPELSSCPDIIPYLWTFLLEYRF